MSWLAGLLTILAFAAAATLVARAASRTGLGAWHPAIAWLALEGVFFGIGSVVLALDGRPGPGLFLSASVLAFGVAVAASHRLAESRTEATRVGVNEVPVVGAVVDADPSPVRVPVAVAFVVAAGVALVPTLIESGVPFLTEDITGARSEVTGIPVQLVRVALPALAIFLAVQLRRSENRSPQRVAATLGSIGVLLAFEVALASRYLAVELLAALVIALGLVRLQVSWRALVITGVIAIAAFGGIQIVRAYDQAAGRELAFAIERTVNRVVLIQPRTIEAFQAAIPAETPPYGGLTWLRRAGPLFGRDDIPNLGYWIYPHLFPDQTTPGYAAPGLLGEAWANFAAGGFLLFIPFGLAVERLGSLVARRRRGTADVVAGALAILFVARTHALGLNGVVLLLVIVAAWRIVAAGGIRGLGEGLRTTLRWR